MNAIQPTGTLLINLRRYLHARGWTKVDHPNSRIEILQTQPDDTGYYGSIAIPNSVDLRDASTLVSDALRLVADYENSPFEKVMDCVSRWDRDILRLRFLKVLGHEDTLPLGIASEAVSGVKEFLGYAAYTHENPQPFFDKAGAISGEFSKNCLFGHTFQGSFGLTIENPLSVATEFLLEGIAPIVPFERQIFERVANGLGTLRDSIARDYLITI